jgi:quaternary ammonium compound-resistance protein SugE
MTETTPSTIPWDWIWLITASLFEVVWVISMKLSRAWTAWIPSLITILAIVGSLSTLSLAMRSLPASLAYGVWVGLGIMGTSLVSWTYFGDTLQPKQIVCLGMIALGCAGLKVFAPTP